jgi:hypothetical protein
MSTSVADPDLFDVPVDICLWIPVPYIEVPVLISKILLIKAI